MASEPRLVREINLGGAGSGSGLLPGVSSNTRYLFSYAESATGQEPWISDGTVVGTRPLRDINPGSASSTPTSFVTDGTRFAFAADDGTSGREPWISDGTAAGTRRIGDLVAGSGGSDPCGFIFAGGNLYFTATTPASGREAYVWTGGAAAPTLIADFTPGSASTFNMNTGIGGSEPYRAAFGANAIFLALDSGVIESIGPGRFVKVTPTGVTVLTVDSRIDVGQEPVPRDQVGVAVGASFYFAATIGSDESEPWVTDGTAGGTRKILDIVPGATKSGPYNWAVFQGQAYFLVKSGNPTGKTAIWRTDGTAAGTIPAVQMERTTLQTGPDEFVVFADQLWFPTSTTRRNTTDFVKLWRSDGTQAGTMVFSGDRFTKVDPNDGSPIDKLTVAGGRLHFLAGTAATGSEWWSTDGSTLLDMGEIIPGPDDIKLGLSTPIHFGGAPGAGLLIAALGGVDRMWLSTGGTAQMLLQPTIGPQPADIGGLTALGTGGALFSAKQADGIGRVWITDGTGAGTRVISDPPVGTNTSPVIALLPRSGTVVGGHVWVGRDDHGQHSGSTYAPLGTEPFVLDPTAADPGLALVADIATGTWTGGISGIRGNASNPDGFTAIGSSVFFRGSSNTHGAEIFRSTGVGATLVSDIRPGSSGSMPRELGVINGKLLFIADDGTHGAEWWAHDPVAGTTQMLLDINPGSGSCEPGPQVNQLRTWVVMGGHAYFRASSGAAGRQLWRTDGTPAGTTLVKTINPSGSAFPLVDNRPYGMGVLGNRLLFAASDGSTGEELWTSDGTSAGTVRLADIAPGSGSSSPYGHVVLGGWSYFSATNGTNGRELWRTDGALVQMVADAVPGSGGLNPCYLVRVGDELFFTGNDGIHGLEPWGYRNGSIQLLKDINPGSAGSGPVQPASGHSPWVQAAGDLTGNLAVSGTTVYFTATQPGGGEELWAYTAQGAGGNAAPVLTAPTASPADLVLP
jgi:ELWxxDGT repeat protein